MSHDLRLPAFTADLRVGLFGGSFDPPHVGHLAVSLVGLRALGLDQVWWLVSPRNPLKPKAPSSDLGRRIAAAHAIARHPRIRVTGIEAALRTTYTADTLHRLLPRLPGVRCVWMMGADNLATFHRWRGWQAIAAGLPVAVFNRPGQALAALSSPAAHAMRRWRIAEADASELAERRPPAWVFLSSPHVAASSTALRAAGRANDSAS
ncbi:MAG: nicotinate-nucleotide adenylyltransferase [Bauldia sp.]